MLAVVPVVSAAVRDGLRGWVPTHDAASVALRAYQSLGAHPPLTGMWSQATRWAHLELHMVGPIELYLLAAPVRLLGPSWGVLLGMAAINSASVVTTGWLVRRRLGPGPAVAVLGFLVALMWSMGSEMLVDPIPMSLGTLPFVLLLVSAWSVADLDLVAVPVLALVATYLFQTHLSYVLLVPLLTAWALVAAATRLVLSRRRHELWPDRIGSTRRLIGWSAGTLVVVALCWAAPAVRAGHAPPREPHALAHAARARGSQAPSPTLRTTFSVMANTLSVPPAWLPPSYIHPSWGYYGGRSLWVSVAGVLVLALLIGAAAVTSWRRRDHTLVLGIATALLAIAVGAVTARHSTSDFGVIAGYVRWLWSIAMFSWFLIAVAAARSVLAWRARERPETAAPAGTPGVRALPAWLPVAGVGVVALLVALTLPTVDNGSSTEPWTIAPTKLLTREVLAGLRPADGVPLVRRQWSGFALSFDASLALELARRGISFRVYGDERIEQYGTQYRVLRARRRLRPDPDPEPVARGALPAARVRVGGDPRAGGRAARPRREGRGVAEGPAVAAGRVDGRREGAAPVPGHRGGHGAPAQRRARRPELHRDER